MLVSTLTSFLLSAMIQWNPPSQHAFYHQGEEYTINRYEDIAHDLAVVALIEEPLDVFSHEYDDEARAHTALLIAAVSSYESGGFREDVDRHLKKGDSGHSVCVAQIWLRPGEVIQSRQDCFRLALSRLRESFVACRTLPINERLAVYASGKCDIGRVAARKRWARMEEFWSSAPWFSEEPLLLPNAKTAPPLVVQ